MLSVPTGIMKLLSGTVLLLLTFSFHFFQDVVAAPPLNADWANNSLTQVMVVNQDKPNKYGELRGYRIQPHAGVAHLTVQDSTNLQNAARWAEYDVQITRQKDSELSSSHARNSQDVLDPPVNFDSFFDGESLDQEDLVVWLNLGMHHVPHTGDLPNTVTTTAHTGIQFIPNNYFLLDQSRQTVNMVCINYGENKNQSQFRPATVNTFGQRDDTCSSLNFDPPETEDLQNYSGDVVVRKFPYDPNNPYYGTDSIT